MWAIIFSVRSLQMQYGGKAFSRASCVRTARRRWKRSAASGLSSTASSPSTGTIRRPSPFVEEVSRAGAADDAREDPFDDDGGALDIDTRRGTKSDRLA